MLIKLENRALIKVEGEGVIAFLQGLVTQDLTTLPAFTAILTPQGKIIADFFVVAVDDYFILEMAKSQQDTLLQKLNLYKLRAKITLTPLGDDFVVYAGDGFEGELSFKDPRHEALGNRIIAHISQTAPTLNDPRDYDKLRIEHEVPQGGIDFIYGDIFPHEANMDKLNGVSFSKGCYVGQEIVSRMQHRGTLKKRVIAYKSEALAPDAGQEVTIGERVIGMSGTPHGKQGLMLVRFDLIDEASHMQAGGISIERAN